MDGDFIGYSWTAHVHNSPAPNLPYSARKEEGVNLYDSAGEEEKIIGS
jgi:hypothetical protein